MKKDLEQLMLNAYFIILKKNPLWTRSSVYWECSLFFSFQHYRDGQYRFRIAYNSRFSNVFGLGAFRSSKWIPVRYDRNELDDRPRSSWPARTGASRWAVLVIRGSTLRPNPAAYLRVTSREVYPACPCLPVDDSSWESTIINWKYSRRTAASEPEGGSRTKTHVDRYCRRPGSNKTIIVESVYRRVRRQRPVVVLSVCARTFTGRIIVYYHNKRSYHAHLVCVVGDIPRWRRRPLQKIAKTSLRPRHSRSVHGSVTGRAGGGVVGKRTSLPPRLVWTSLECKTKSADSYRLKKTITYSLVSSSLATDRYAQTAFLKWQNAGISIQNDRVARPFTTRSKHVRMRM